MCVNMCVYIYIHTHIYTHIYAHTHTHTHTQNHLHVYMHVHKANECTLLYYGSPTLFHKQDCRKGLDNPLLDSEDRQTFSFSAVSYNTQNM